MLSSALCRAATAGCRRLATRPAFDEALKTSMTPEVGTYGGEQQEYANNAARSFRGINRVELYGYIGGVYTSLTARNTESVSILLNIPGESIVNPDGSRYAKPGTSVTVRSFSPTHFNMYKTGALGKGMRAVVFGSLHSVTYEKGSVDPATNAELLNNTRRLFINAERIIAIPRAGATVEEGVGQAEQPAAAPPTGQQYDADYDDK